MSCVLADDLLLETNRFFNQRRLKMLKKKTYLGLNFDIVSSLLELEVPLGLSDLGVIHQPKNLLINLTFFSV
jgi:hypothetical protein